VREVVWKPRLNRTPGSRKFLRKGVWWVKGTFSIRLGGLSHAIKTPRGVLAVAVVEVAAVQASARSFSAHRPVEFVREFRPVQASEAPLRLD
jgi:hypothetical protein